MHDPENDELIDANQFVDAFDSDCGYGHQIRSHVNAVPHLRYQLAIEYIMRCATSAEVGQLPPHGPEIMKEREKV